MTPETYNFKGATLREASKRFAPAQLGLSRWWSIALLLFWGVLYSLFLSQSYLSQGVRYAEAIERHDPASVIFAGHILYGFVGDLAYRVVGWLGYAGRAYYVLQWLSVPFALGGLILFYRLLLRLRLSTRAAVLAAFGLGSTYFYWEYGVNAEVYAAASFLVILTLYLVVRAAAGQSRVAWVFAGIAAGLAILIHQLNILLPVAVALALFALPESLGRRVEKIVLFGATTFAAVAVPYFAIWSVVAGRVTGLSFLDWAFIYLRPQFTGGTRVWSIDPSRLWGGAYGLGRALFGPYFVSQALENPRTSWALLAVVAVLVSVGIGILVLNSLRVARREWTGDRLAWTLAFALVLVYGVFVVLWEGVTLQYWFAVWIGIWVCIALGFDRPRVRSSLQGYLNAGLALIVGGLFVTNLAGALLPESDVRNSEDYRYSLFVMNTVPENSLIVLPGWGGLSNGVLLNYFGRYHLTTLSERLSQPADLNAGIRTSLCSLPGVYLVSDRKQLDAARTFSASATVLEKVAASRGAWDILGNPVQSFLSDYGYQLTPVAEYRDGFNPRYEGNGVWQLKTPGTNPCSH